MNTSLPEISLQRAVFASDIHCDAAQPKTLRRFTEWLVSLTQLDLELKPDYLFLLGDVFEAYVGDDDDSETIAAVVAALQTVRIGGIQLGLLHGNRDFLMGADFVKRIDAQLFDAQVIIVCGGVRYLLAHGDEWCTADTNYQTARTTLRCPQFQQGFLHKSLAERQQIASNMRLKSEHSKSELSMQAMDVVAADVCAALSQHQCQTAIHGHTHRPGQYALQAGLDRWVLSDWHFDDAPNPSGAQVLNLDASGVALSRLV